MYLFKDRNVSDLFWVISNFENKVWQNSQNLLNQYNIRFVVTFTNSSSLNLE